MSYSRKIICSLGVGVGESVNSVNEALIKGLLGSHGYIYIPIQPTRSLLSIAIAITHNSHSVSRSLCHLIHPRE